MMDWIVESWQEIYLLSLDRFVIFCCGFSMLFGVLVGMNAKFFGLDFSGDSADE